MDIIDLKVDKENLQPKKSTVEKKKKGSSKKQICIKMIDNFHP